MTTLHSFLFAVLPFAVFLANNLGVVPLSLSDVSRSLAAILAGHVAALLLVGLRRPLAAAAMTLSWFYILLTLYPLVHRIVSRLNPDAPELMWAGAHLVISAVAAMWLGKPGAAPAKDAMRAKAFSIAGVIIVCGNLGFGLFAASPHHQTRWRPAVDSILRDAPRPARLPEQPPDIYYVILDGFGRPDVLRRIYGIDLSPEVEQLRNLGWTVTLNSRSNYSQTYLSVSSALNGRYLDSIADVMGQRDDRRPLYYAIQHSEPIAALKRAGYQFQMIGSHTSVTARHEMADVCDCEGPGFNEFENGLLWSTLFRAVPLYEPTYGAHYRSLRHAFDALESVPVGPPRLILAHVLAPHPPFVLDADGRAVLRRGGLIYHEGEDYPGSLHEYRSGYAGQATYFARRLVRFARSVASRQRPTVVVVHGDHGPGSRYSHRTLARTDVSERFPILMAIKLGAGASIPDDLSPVNTFRVIFNAHFGANDPLLPNKSYYATWPQPYRFTEVQLP